MIYQTPLAEWPNRIARLGRDPPDLRHTIAQWVMVSSVAP
jgi:hypothetical protein